MTRFYLGSEKQFIADVTEGLSQFGAGISAVATNGDRFSISNLKTGGVYPQNWDHEYADLPIADLYKHLQEKTNGLSLKSFDAQSLIEEA